MLGLTVEKLCQTTQVISSTVGTNTLTISPLGGTYYNVSDLANCSDFQNMATAYQVCRIKSIRLVVNRVCSENQLTTVFPNGISTMYIAYYPTVNSSTISSTSITSAENAMIISPFNNRASSRTFVLPNLIVGYSLTQFFSVNLISTAKGQFSIGSYGTGTAASTNNIFTLTAYFDMQFGVPF